MATSSVFNLTRFTSLAAGDVIPAVDVSDTTQSAHGSLDAITVTNFFGTIPVPIVVTSASAAALAVGRQGATNPALNVDASTASSVTGINITAKAAASGVAIAATSSGTNEDMTVDAKGTGAITLGTTSTGSIVVKRLLDISGAAAGQIKFPATQNPSADANTLDDYEEGTWTPTVGGNSTATTATGRYVKIGKQATVGCVYKVNALGTGSASTLSGLPFASVNGGTYATAPLSFWSGLQTSQAYVVGVVAPNVSTVTFNGQDATNAVSISNTTISLFGNNAEVRFSAPYEAAA